MRPAAHGLRDAARVAAAAIVLAAMFAASGAQAQTTVTRDDITGKLNHFETPAEIDLPALRLRVAERSKSRAKNEPPPQKRPPIAPELSKLPTVNFDIAFDVDTPIILPESYQTIGRIADAMTHSSLLPYTFLIVGHINSTGRRENNVLLSQRRADAVRDILVNTFKIATKRLQSVGLGEELLLDPNRPTGPVNDQLQIMTVAKLADVEPAAKPAAAAPAAKKKPTKKK